MIVHVASFQDIHHYMTTWHILSLSLGCGSPSTDYMRVCESADGYIDR